MFGYFIKAFILAIYLSFVKVSSYAAESSTQFNKLKVDSAIQKMSAASSLYSQACNLAQLDSLSKEKANLAFSNVIEITRTALVDIPPHNTEVYKTCVQLQAISQRQLGTLRYNRIIEELGDPKKVSELSINLLREAIKHFENSFSLYSSIKDWSNVSIVSQSLVPSCETFATLCVLRAEIETRPSMSIALYEECMASKERSISLLKGQIEKVSMSHFQALSLHRMLRVYGELGFLFDDLCARLKQNNSSLAPNYTFKMCATDTSNLVKFWERRIVSAKVDCTIYPPQPSSKQNNKTVRKQKSVNGVVDVTSPFMDLLDALPPVLDAEDFLDRIRTFQCGILWGVYQEDLNNDISRKVAYASYKKYVYQNEFANDVAMEEAFILAQLEDLIGNPESLNRFYKDLHAKRKQARHQKMVDVIKEDLKSKQIEKEEREAIAQDKLKTVKRRETTSFPAQSSSSYEYSSAEPQVVEIVPPKIKEKTRGVPLPQDEAEIKSVIQEETNLSKEEAQFKLSHVEYNIYQKINKGEKITVKESIIVLNGFKCKIEEGAKHKKATAQNGRVWTIPFHSQREGPLDPAYRRSLRNFLHITLEIDPQDVVLKK